MEVNLTFCLIIKYKSCDVNKMYANVAKVFECKSKRAFDDMLIY